MSLIPPTTTAQQNHMGWEHASDFSTQTFQLGASKYFPEIDKNVEKKERWPSQRRLLLFLANSKQPLRKAFCDKNTAFGKDCCFSPFVPCHSCHCETVHSRFSNLHNFTERTTGVKMSFDCFFSRVERVTEQKELWSQKNVALWNPHETSLCSPALMCADARRNTFRLWFDDQTKRSCVFSRPTPWFFCTTADIACVFVPVDTGLGKRFDLPEARTHYLWTGRIFQCPRDSAGAPERLFFFNVVVSWACKRPARRCKHGRQTDDEQK